MKKRFLFFLALILSLALPLQCYALVQQSESFYVCDDAGVLSGQLEDKIISLNAQLENQCRGAQLVVVSVEYMDGLYADEYAYALMNDWGVGSAAENNGMLLLFATKENKGWLAVGAGIIGSFDEDAVDHYLDQYFWDAYDRGDYEKGVEKLTEALASWYEKHYNTVSFGSTYSSGYTESYYYAPAPAPSSSYQRGGTGGTILLLIILFLLLTRSRRRRAGGGNGNGLLNFLFWNQLFNFNNNNHRPPSGGSSHSGGFGGSSHSGGFGGSSHSGGFGGGGHSGGFGGGGHSGGGGGRR